MYLDTIHRNSSYQVIIKFENYSNFLLPCICNSSIMQTFFAVHTTSSDSIQINKIVEEFQELKL